jgi:hypothetical protein
MGQKEKAGQALSAAEAMPAKTSSDRLLLSEAKRAVTGK